MATKKTKAPAGLIEISTNVPEFRETEPLFSIDGVVYEIPKRISGSVALAFLSKAKDFGEMIALAWLVEEVMGAEAHAALTACKTVTGPQMAAVITVIKDRTLAAVEDIQGE